MAKVRTPTIFTTPAGCGARVLPGVRGKRHRRDDGDLGRGRGDSSACIPAARAWSATTRCAAAGSSFSPARRSCRFRLDEIVVIETVGLGRAKRDRAGDRRQTIRIRAAPRSRPTSSCARRQDGAWSCITRRPRRWWRPARRQGRCTKKQNGRVSCGGLPCANEFVPTIRPPGSATLSYRMVCRR